MTVVLHILRYTNLVLHRLQLWTLRYIPMYNCSILIPTVDCLVMRATTYYYIKLDGNVMPATQ